MSAVVNVAIGALLLLGGGLCLIAAFGIARMPDIMLRMHASTKAGTLGCSLMLLAVALHHGDDAVSLRALAAIAFLVLTTPVAAHIIGRSAYLSGARLLPQTRYDDLSGMPRKPPPQAEAE